LPENVSGLCAASQDDMNRAAHFQIGCDLEDPDIIGTTREGDVRSRYQSRAREFVEAGDKVQPADIPGSGIQERTRRCGCSSGGVVERRGQIALGRE